MTKTTIKGLLVIGILLAATWWFLRDPVIHVGASPSPDAAAVILLHGSGAPADDLEPLAGKLAKSAPEACFLIPAAPFRAGMGGRTWLKSVRAESKEELAVLVEEMRHESRETVLKLVRKLRDEGIPPERILVGGFSLGAQVGLDALLDPDEGAEIGGLIFMSGPTKDLELDRLAARPPVRAFVSHGRSDRIAGFQNAEKLVQLLQENGHEVSWLDFDGGHQIPNMVVRALGEFIAETTKPRRP